VSTKLDDGGQAFPLQRQLEYPHNGMSLRDYFAAQALVGLALGFEEPGDVAGARVGVAEDAYRIADAMLAERAKGAKP
jgi:hypothetical protein